MCAIKNARLQQDPDEFAKLLEIVSRCGRVLEVGSRYGESTKALANAMPKGSRIVSVDMPRGPWGADSEPDLRRNIAEIITSGYDAHLFIGDSKDQTIIDQVKSLGTYDLVFLDADHTYKGVKADFDNYGKLGTIVAFHDITPPAHNQELQVWKFWQEMRDFFPYQEFVTKDSLMGIGVLHVG